MLYSKRNRVSNIFTYPITLRLFYLHVNLIDMSIFFTRYTFDIHTSPLSGNFKF